MNIARLGIALLAALALLAAGCGSDDAADGAGYTYDVPDGWEGASEDEIDELAPIADTITIGEERDGFATNINVIAVGAVPPDTDLAAEVDRGIRALQQQPGLFGLPAGSTVEVTREPTETTLAGEDAIEVEFTTDTGSQALLQRQVSAVGPDGDAFTITATSIGDTADRDAAMDEALGSWAWD